jgi:type I restriction enzyme S subunit
MLKNKFGKIVNIKDEKILYEYLYLYLLSDLFQNKVKLECCDSDRNNISTNTILDFKIPLPSLEIQEKIVEELSKIETNIKSIETRIKQLKEEKERFKKYSRKSEIKELLKDAEIKKLGEVCEISQGSSINKNNRIKGNIPYFGSNGIIDYINKSQHDGEYIITGRAGTLGTYHYYNGPFSLCDNAFYIKITYNSLLAKYLYHYSNNIYSYLNMNTGGTVPCINKEKLYNLKIPIPSPEIQEQCIQIYQEKEFFLQSIDDKIEAEKNYINELKILTKDIIYSYC